MTIPQEIYDLYKSTVRDFNGDDFGTPCTLYYSDKQNECPNCFVNPVTKVSTNQYKSGGPISFSNGECPYCNGIGYVSQNDSESIKMRVYFDKKSYAKLAVPMNMGQVDCVTYGNIEDMAKCLKCQEMDVYGQRYSLIGQPHLRGLLRKDFFLAAWELKK